MNMNNNYDNTNHIIFDRFFDNFQDNPFCLRIYHQPDSIDDRLDTDLELVRRPIILQVGYLVDLGEPEDEDDYDAGGPFLLK